MSHFGQQTGIEFNSPLLIHDPCEIWLKSALQFQVAKTYSPNFSFHFITTRNDLRRTDLDFVISLWRKLLHIYSQLEAMLLNLIFRRKNETSKFIYEHHSSMELSHVLNF